MMSMLVKICLLLVFGFHSDWALESEEVCFTLKGQYKYNCTEWGWGGTCKTLNYHYGYFLADTPQRVTVTLTCQQDEYAILESVEYSIPKSWSNYGTTQYSAYCPDKTIYGINKCYYNKCQCCTKPDPAHICTHIIVNVGETDYCKTQNSSLGTCDVRLPRYDFAGASCVDYSRTCQANDGSNWCYARWVTAKYHCESATASTGNLTTTPTSTTSNTTPTPTTSTTLTTTTIVTTLTTTNTDITLVTTTPASQSSKAAGRTTAQSGGLPDLEVNGGTITTINIGLVSGLSVCVVVILIGIAAGVTVFIIHRKKQRNAGERPTADTSAYYNVSAATRLHPHNTAPKIPRRNPHAESTASYEQIALTGDYYNMSQVLDRSKASETIYELPQRDGNEIAERSNTGNVYQPLENATTGSDQQATAVDYEHVDISSDYLTTVY